MKLLGKVALVTGGSRGIGRAICLSLGAEGADVVVNYVHDEAAAKQVASILKNNGRRAMCIRADVGSYAEVEKMIQEALNSLGKVDVLINNAGFAKPKSFLKSSKEEWDKCINTHLHGTFNCCRLVLPLMIKEGTGRIINISSPAALTGYHGYASYCAAKAGIIGLSKSLTKEFASRGIYINVVSPGFIPTELQNGINAEQRGRALEGIPMRRFGKVEEVAEVVTFLACGATFINGQVIHVDGGRS